MAVFNDLIGGHYTEKDREIKNMMETFYRDSITYNQTFWSEAAIDSRFEAGDQDVIGELYDMSPRYRNKSFNFNRIKRIINMISGYQRKNRKSTVVTPIENGDQQTADQFTKIMIWLNQKEGSLDTVSEAFHGAIITGLNLLQVWIDYSTDPFSGNIKIDNCPANTFLIDPFYKKKDLSDCSHIWKRNYITVLDAKSMYHDDTELIEELSKQSGKDGKFTYTPESMYSNNKELLIYDEFYYRSRRPQIMLFDKERGESFEWTSNHERLREYLSVWPEVKVVEQDIPTVNVALVLQGKVMYDGGNPMGIDTFPFVPVYGYFKPDIVNYSSRLQGVVRGLRDSQFLYNRRKVIELDMLESQINSGIKFKEGTLVNEKDAFLRGQGKPLVIRKGKDINDVQQMIPPVIPPTTLEVSAAMGRELQEISGVSDELLGMAVDDKAAILSMYRTGNNLVTLQPLLDGLDYSQKLLGTIWLKIIQINFSPGKVKNIINEEPTSQFYDKTFGKYDAAIEEGVNTTTQRQAEFITLMNLKEMGVAVPDEAILKAATIQNKDEIIKQVEQQAQQAQQLEQQKFQVEAQEAQARIELAKARSNADNSLGAERVSRIPENRAMAIANIAEANKDDEQAMLNKLKAMTELEGLDLANLEKFILIAKALKGDEQMAKKELAIKANVTSSTTGGL